MRLLLALLALLVTITAFAQPSPPGVSRPLADTLYSNKHPIASSIATGADWLPVWQTGNGNGFGTGFTPVLPFDLIRQTDGTYTTTIDQTTPLSVLTPDWINKARWPRLYLDPVNGADGNSGNQPTTGTSGFKRSMSAALAEQSGIYGIAITGATNTSPIVLTVASLPYRPYITVAGVLGNTAANGLWRWTRVSATQISLTGSTGNGAYTSGGTIALPRVIVPWGTVQEFRYGFSSTRGGTWNGASQVADTIVMGSGGYSGGWISSMQMAEQPTWTNSSGTTWFTTYAVAITTATSDNILVTFNGVIDTVGQPRRLIKASSQANCEATLYSYFLETTSKIYVNVGQGTAPDTSSLRVFRSSANGNKSDDPYTLICVGGTFRGGTGGAFRVGSNNWTSTYNPKIAFVNCIFEYTPESVNAFSVITTAQTLLYNCDVRFSGADGVNVRRGKMMEIESRFYGNGYLSTAQSNSSINYLTSLSFGTNQGSTLHTNGKAIRVGSSYYQNGGQGIGDTGTFSGSSGATGTPDCYSLNIGNRIYNQLGITGTGKGNADIYVGSDAGDRAVFLQTVFKNPAGVASTTTWNYRIEQGNTFTDIPGVVSITAGTITVIGLYKQTSSAFAAID